MLACGSLPKELEVANQLAFMLRRETLQRSKTFLTLCMFFARLALLRSMTTKAATASSMHPRLPGQWACTSMPTSD
eukprot:1718388-Pleurochrysis_carterae.AAC.2